MKMIWPGRALGIAALIPALVSLTLFVSEDFLPFVLCKDHPRIVIIGAQ